MFAGREAELKRLEGLYSSTKFECVVLHGRRRVGKTALLREFMKGKGVIYFAAQETCSPENLQNLTRCINAFGRDPTPGPQESNSFEAAIERVFRLAQSERVMLIIDDYQFLTQCYRTISELICSQINQNHKSSLLMLVICGSSVPVMEKEAVGFDSPFHGQRTAQIKLQPFTFFETRKFYNRFSLYDIAILYGVTGGVAKYMGLMDPDLPIEENIRRSFFDTSSFLFEEPANIIRREVRDPTYYNAVLRAIATGCSKNSEIAETVGLDTAACTAYLRNLSTLDIVSKHTPITEKAGKKTIYGINDNMFRFWFRFVPDNISLIRAGGASRIWRNIARDMPVYMISVFEDICRQWLEQRNSAGRLPIYAVEFGRWWGVDPVSKAPTFVPILAYSDDNHAIFGDCVWSDEPAGAEVLESLITRSRVFNFSKIHFYLFSCSGFTRECTAIAERVGANLVMFE